jgi:hypothetical protein
MPELELGIGHERGINGGWERDWLYWYDAFGNRYATNEEIARQEREIAQQEREQRLAAETIATQEREQRRLAEERLAELEARLKAIEGTDN